MPNSPKEKKPSSGQLEDMPSPAAELPPPEAAAAPAAPQDVKKPQKRKPSRSRGPTASSLSLPNIPKPTFPPGNSEFFIPQEDTPPSAPVVSTSAGGAAQPEQTTTITEEKVESNLLQQEDIQDRQANRELRDKYAHRAYSLAQGSICFWMVVVSVNGLLATILPKSPISDNVIFALTTGVTVNVLAAFLGVIRGLFPVSASCNGNGANKPKQDKKSPTSGKKKH